MKWFKYILILLVMTLAACNNVVENTNIPYAAVSFVIDVSPSGSDYELSGIWVPKVYNKENPAKMSAGYGAYGYSGVVVIRGDNNQLYAFDTCCPYEAKRAIALKPDGYLMVCPACGSQFSIGNGSGYVNKGPATEPLKTYHVYRNGTDIYRVTN